MTPEQVEIETLRQHKASLQKRLIELEQRHQEQERILLSYVKQLHKAEEQKRFMRDMILLCSGSCKLPKDYQVEIG